MNIIDKLSRFATFLILVSLCIGFLGLAQRSHDACVQRQRSYDGQIVYTRFLAHEFGATPAQVTKGLADLRATVGARPSC